MTSALEMLKAERDKLQRAIAIMEGDADASGQGAGKIQARPGVIGRKQTMSASSRARMAAAQKARWAKVKATSAGAPAGKKRILSAQTRANIAAGARARWAKMKVRKLKPHSAETKARIAATQKARWAKIRAGK